MTPVIKKLLSMLTSRKFIGLVLSVLLAYGLDIKPELQALIITLAGIVWAITTAWEDNNRKLPPS